MIGGLHLRASTCRCMSKDRSGCSPRTVKPWRESLRILCHTFIRKIYGLVLSTRLEHEVLDAKTGLLTGLLAGKQDWKCPVALLMTCCGSKSLKVILIDSDFRAYPLLNPLVTLYLTPSSRKDFFKGKNLFSHQALSRLAGYQRWGKEECSTHLVQTFPDL